MSCFSINFSCLLVLFTLLVTPVKVSNFNLASADNKAVELKKEAVTPKASTAVLHGDLLYNF